MNHPPRKILQAFKTWDKDGNGFITKDELADVQLGGLNAGKRACLGWKSRKQMICFSGFL
jgi:Ca2+-binding EF-hand superfamily protein